MTDIDERLTDPYNYISMPVTKSARFEKNTYLFLNRHLVQAMCEREVILRNTAKAIGKDYP